jgi:hypothetical protein
MDADLMLYGPSRESQQRTAANGEENRWRKSPEPHHVALSYRAPNGHPLNLIRLRYGDFRPSECRTLALSCEDKERNMAKTKTGSAEKTDETNPDLATVSGVAAGAAVGSLLGPPGAAVGAVVGGVAGKNAGKKSPRRKSSSSSPMKKTAAKAKAAAKKTKSVAKKAMTSAKKTNAKATKKRTAKRKR